MRDRQISRPKGNPCKKKDIDNAENVKHVTPSQKFKMFNKRKIRENPPKPIKKMNLHLWSSLYKRQPKILNKPYR